MKTHHTEVSAFVLHSKNYQESSQIIQLFSFELGRFSIIAKGIKAKRSQARKALLQPFIELKVIFTGKSDLKTLVHCEVLIKQDSTSLNQSLILGLKGKALACGYYANELILRACMERLEYPQLYNDYKSFISLLKLKSLELEEITPSVIRDFEIALLSDIGLAPDCLFDIESNEIIADKEYQLIPARGFQLLSPDRNQASLVNQSQEPSSEYRVNPSLEKTQYDSYIGQAILSLASGLHYPENYKSTQKIMAVFLREIIGNKPLQSRKLWQHLNSMENQCY